MQELLTSIAARLKAAQTPWRAIAAGAGVHPVTVSKLARLKASPSVRTLGRVDSWLRSRGL